MAYKNAFNATGNKFNTSTKSNKIKVKSTIERINVDVKNGNSFYYFTIKGNDNIFIGSTQISNEIPITLIGDSIEIVYEADTEKLIGISNFKNISVLKK
jgi:ribosomal protein L31